MAKFKKKDSPYHLMIDLNKDFMQNDHGYRKNILKSDLIRLRQILNDTLEHYDFCEYTDEIIEERNNKIITKLN